MRSTPWQGSAFCCEKSAGSHSAGGPMASLPRHESTMNFRLAGWSDVRYQGVRQCSSPRGSASPCEKRWPESFVAGTTGRAIHVTHLFTDTQGHLPGVHSRSWPVFMSIGAAKVFIQQVCVRVVCVPLGDVRSSPLDSRKFQTHITVPRAPEALALGHRFQRLVHLKESPCFPCHPPSKR